MDDKKRRVFVIVRGGWFSRDGWWRNFLGKSVGPSEIFLICVNLIPVAGILFFGWKLFDIFFLYWLESAIIGFFGMLKMITVGFYSGPGGIISLLFLVPFFAVHYGMFMLGHLAFIFLLTGPFGFPPPTGIPFSSITEAAQNSLLSVSLPFILMFLSHSFSFSENFIGKREFLKQKNMMFLPYGRIIVMHLSIFLTFFAVGFLRIPAIAPGLIIVTKILADLRAHRKEHEVEGVLVHSAPRGQ